MRSLLVRTNRRAISVYGWVAQCSGYPDTKARRPPTPGRLFLVPPGRQVGYHHEFVCCGIMDVQTAI